MLSAEHVERELESAAERMDPIDVIRQVKEAWDHLPKDVQDAIKAQGRQAWDLRGAYLARFMIAVNAIFGQNPAGWQQALTNNRAQASRQIAQMAGQMAGLQARRNTEPPGMSRVQVREYRRRQRARGYNPGRQRQRELEMEVDQACREFEQELELPESFYTKVTPIPGIGNKEGHEILTRHAMSGLPLSAADRSAIELGVIRPDRGGRSYWNFPRSAVESLRAAAQPAHSLRPTPSTTTAAALRLIQSRFAGLHRRARLATTRQTALEWIGEALHLLQDSYSSAHVDRAAGVGPIRYIRAFFLRFGWPPRSTAPGEHNAPSDPRDDVFLGGALRPEARAAINASRAYLIMALRHLAAPRSPSNRTELRAFIRRYLS